MKRSNTGLFFRSFFLTLTVLVCAIFGFGGFIIADQNTNIISGNRNYHSLSVERQNKIISLSFLGSETKIDTEKIESAIKKAEPTEYLITPEYRLITSGFENLKNKIIEILPSVI